MSNMTVAAIIPAYNAQQFIQRALDSVFSQRARPDLILVIDDGSTDSTDQLVRDWAESHREMKLHLVKQENKGVAAARNRGILEADTQLIALLDADDQWMPEHLAKLTEAFELNNKLVVAFGNQSIFLERENRTVASFLDNTRLTEIETDDIGDGFLLLKESAYSSLIGGNYVPTSASIFDRQKIIEAGLYDEDFTTSEDRDLLLRISRLGKFAYTKDILASKREQHGVNLTDNANYLGKTRNSYMVVAKQWHNRVALDLTVAECEETRRIMKESANDHLYSASKLGLVQLTRAAIRMLEDGMVYNALIPRHWFRALFASAKNIIKAIN